MVDDDSISVLNRLLETCRDAMEGFHTAANAVHDPALRRLFTTYAQQRHEFVRELEAEIRRLGGTPQRRGSVTGTLHRALINVRAAVSAREETVVIAEAERGEEAAKTVYDDALSRASLPADVRNVIARQALRIREAHAALRDLERAA